MSGSIVKRSISIAGHRTSVSLEEPFWEELRSIAASRGTSVQSVVGRIDAGRGDQNLSSAIRVFVLQTIRAGDEASSRELRPEGGEAPGHPVVPGGA